MVSNKLGGGIKIANNLITTEEGYVLDARQGKILDEKIVETKNDLLKMIQASGTISGNVDWNNYISTGVYIVNAATMTAECHAPVGLHRYGTLIVILPAIGQFKRVLQLYYPHNIASSNSLVMATRTYEINAWQPWYAVSGILLQ